MSVSATKSAEGISDSWEEREANRLMRIGITHLLRKRSEDDVHALKCFEDTIRLRSRLLDLHPEHAWVRYTLAGAWLNQAQALARLEGAERREQSIASHRMALQLLESISGNQEVLFQKRRIIAWLNLGHVLVLKNEPYSKREAEACFNRVLSLADEIPVDGTRDASEMKASAWTNLSLLLSEGIDQKKFQQAEAYASRALRTFQNVLPENTETKEGALKARLALCKSKLGQQSLMTRDEWDVQLTGITDVVEDGLKHSRPVMCGDPSPDRDPYRELFRLGCTVYQIHLPQFLSEYLREWILESTGEQRHWLDEWTLEHAIESVRCAMEVVLSRHFETLHDSASELSQVLAELRSCAKRLKDLTECNSPLVEGKAWLDPDTQK